MQRRMIRALAVLALVGLVTAWPNAADAQQRPRYSNQPKRVSRMSQQTTRRPRLRGNKQPSVSPYLNLLDSPGRLEFQYYRRLRPEREFRSAGAALGRSIEQLQQENEQLRRFQQFEEELQPTGFTTSFMTHWRYFGIGLPPR